jgi:hypothetical protein
VKCQAMENTYSKNRSVIPGKFNIYRSCIKSSIEVLKYNQVHPIWAQDNPYIFNFNYQFQLFHSIQYLSQYNKAKGTIFFKRDYFRISSDWWISGLTPKQQDKLVSLIICWLTFYSLDNINPKKMHKVCGCLIFTSISVQMQRYPLEDF